MQKQIFFLFALSLIQLVYGMDVPNQDLYLELCQMVDDQNVPAVRDLLIRGADVNAVRPTCRYSPLVLAIMRDNEEIFELLLDIGADVNNADKEGFSPLMLCIPSRVSMMRLLLARGADSNASETRYGTTPLMLAARSRHLQSCRLLLQYGADSELQDKEGDRAIDYANDPWPTPYNEVEAVLISPKRIREVIMHEDNPVLIKFRRVGGNICNALMERELGLK
jgi:hypothetical protein